MHSVECNSIGYTLKVDRKYPDKLHELHNYYPLAPEKLEIKYVLHYRNLQLYLLLGMKLTSVNRILKFKQSDWLKKYIDFNTDKRKNAANSF